MKALQRGLAPIQAISAPGCLHPFVNDNRTRTAPPPLILEGAVPLVSSTPVTVLRKWATRRSCSRSCFRGAVLLGLAHRLGHLRGHADSHALAGALGSNAVTAWLGPRRAALGWFLSRHGGVDNDSPNSARRGTIRRPHRQAFSAARWWRSLLEMGDRRRSPPSCS